MTRITFIAEKGNKGPDNVSILLEGMEDLPKYLILTAEDFVTPIGTGRAFVEDGVLKVEAELREEDFKLYPAIGFQSLEEENNEGDVIVKRSVLHNVTLQTTPNVDAAILSVYGQIESGEAYLLYY